MFYPKFTFLLAGYFCAKNELRCVLPPNPRWGLHPQTPAAAHSAALRATSLAPPPTLIKNPNYALVPMPKIVKKY